MAMYLKHNSPNISKKEHIFFVDEINETETFGITESMAKVNSNLEQLENIFTGSEYENTLKKSSHGLTTLFPIGQFIAILKISKDKKEKVMYFLSHLIPNFEVDSLPREYFSDSVKYEFKKIKRKMNETYNFPFYPVILKL